jgi:hypothetical protein
VTAQVYYVPSGFADPYPPDITSYLDSIQTKIGAEVAWEETNDEVYNNFSDIGKPLFFFLLADSLVWADGGDVSRRLDAQFPAPSRAGH